MLHQCRHPRAAVPTSVRTPEPRPRPSSVSFRGPDGTGPLTNTVMAATMRAQGGRLHGRGTRLGSRAGGRHGVGRPGTPSRTPGPQRQAGKRSSNGAIDAGPSSRAASRRAPPTASAPLPTSTTATSRSTESSMCWAARPRISALMATGTPPPLRRSRASREPVDDRVERDVYFFGTVFPGFLAAAFFVAAGWR